MSVKACDREGCIHVMCDRYNANYGYICEECFDELADYLLSAHACTAVTDGDSIGRFISAFMKHPKGFLFPKRRDVIRGVEKLAEGIFPFPRDNPREYIRK